MEDLSRLLGEHPFLKGIEGHHIDFLVGCAKNVVFAKEEFLFREGKPADELFLIRYGQVAVQAFSPGKGTMTLATLGEGEVVGWSWVVEPYVAHFDVVALTPVRAVSLDAKCLRTKLKIDHELGYQILARVVQVMEHRLQATRLQLLDLYGNDR